MLKTSNKPFGKCKTKKEVIHLYLRQLEELKKNAKIKYAIESSEFFVILQNEHRTPPISTAIKKQRQKKEFKQDAYKHLIQLKQYSLWIAFIVIAAVLVINYEEFSKIFMRNIQTFIYPGMRIWRKWTLPMIRKFPQLTNLYDETCLVSNPFFRVSDLDCSPCADVINVVDLSISPHLSYFDNNIPHIIRQTNNDVTIAQLYQLYQQNRKMFQNNAYNVQSTDHRITNLDQLFDILLNKNGALQSQSSHNLWRVNRMEPARLLRKLFPQPKSLPMHSSIDIERYIAIDIDGGVTYQLPSTDCSNMFVYQAIGSRMIHLQPTIECKHQCRRLSVILKQNHTLFYDWWYYKPISANQFTKTTSVSYIGSYC